MYRPFLLALSLVVLAPAQTSPSKAPFTFIRQFATAQDANSSPEPLVNRLVDAAAGPPDSPEQPPLVLQQPFDITTDLAHRLYVTDRLNASIHLFDYLRSKYSELKGPAEAPIAIATDRQGNVYVSDSSLRTVLIFDSKGKFNRYLKKPRGDETYFDGPRGIAIDSAGHIYICDTPRQMVIVLDRKGGLMSRIGIRGGGSGPAEFRNPTRVAVSGDEIAVLDSGNTRVQVLDLRGHFHREIKLPYADIYSGLAIDSEKNVYVSDPELNHIQVFGSNGHVLYEFGQSGDRPGEFDHLSGLWVDSGKCLYAADVNNRRVQQFRIGSGALEGC